VATLVDAVQTPEGTSLVPSGRLRRRYTTQRIAVTLLTVSTLVTVVVTGMIVLSLFPPTIDFFRETGWQVFGLSWAPLFFPPDFGMAPLIVGTLSVVAVALVVAVPTGLAAAFYLAEYAHPNVRRIAKPILELLAGVPTVVLGFFGLYFVNPEIVGRLWPFSEITAFSALGAGLVTGFLVMPIMASIAEDAMTAVPNSLREAGYAVGATRREVSTRVIFGAALSGITAAVILTAARAFGETTVALMVAGSNSQLTWDIGQGMQTMASFIGFAGIGDQPTDSVGYRTIFAVGMFLFLITFVTNIAGNRIVRRFREAYE
jgi:phosphate transport system permease protein